MFLKSNKPTSKIETVVGSGTELEGNLESQESIRIDGKIKGNIKCEGVVVGEFGIVLGDINAQNVTIAGKVKGNISAKESLELLPKAQILGDLQTAKLSISDGACFEGNCQMIKTNGQVIELNPQALPNDAEYNGKHLKVANAKH